MSILQSFYYLSSNRVENEEGRVKLRVLMDID